MATTLDLIKRSLRILDVRGSGESIPADEAADALTVINAMLDEWRNEKLMCYAFQDQTITLVNGQATYTVGPTGDLVTTRPVKIESAYFTEGGYDYPVNVLSRAEWDGITDKTTTSSFVDSIQLEGTYPDATIKVWPVPNAANSIKIKTWTPLTAMTLSQTFALPPGYENAIVYNLAIDIAPEFGAEPSALIYRKAKTAKAGIKRVNSRPIAAGSELALLFSGSNVSTDIEAGL